MKNFVIASILSFGVGLFIAEQAAAADTTPPSIAATVTGTTGANDWYTSNVGLSWTVTDPESRIRSTTGCGSVSITSDTSGHTYTCTATSRGGTSSRSVTIKRDATLPTATITAPGNGATYSVGQAVAASFSCTDAMSGVASCTGPVAAGAAINTTSVGAKTFTVTATDNAGKAKAATVSYNVVDTTPPMITPTVSGTLGNNGWYTSNVNVTWSVTDAQSTISASTGCIPVSIAADTSAAGTTITCSATSAGGSSSRSVTIKRDATLPGATIATPAFGAVYTQSQTVIASFACSDSLAGIAICTGTTANGVAIDTSSTGTKTFTVSAVDQAGNLTTKSVSYSVTGSTASGSGRTRLFAWNDLGMHCMDTDYSVFTLLPPFNDLNAQLMVNGKLVSSGYTLAYQSASDPTNTTSINTYSVGPIKKTNFWDFFLALFGLGDLPPNLGMSPDHNPAPSATPAPMKWNSVENWFEATGIPITPTDDAGNFNPFPTVLVSAKNSSGQVIASTRTVLPVSTEMNCKVCHASGTGSAAAKPAGDWVGLTPGSERDWRLNVLRLHDEKNAGNGNYSTLLSSKGYGTSLEGSVTKLDSSQNKPIFCDTCHNSNALAIWGLGGVAGVSNMSAAMHSRHANAPDPSGKTLDSDPTRGACYSCHPGKDTQCLRGAMGNPLDANGKHVMECQSCHGPISVVGSARVYDPTNTAGRARAPWFDMPTCQSCHQNGQRKTVAFTIDPTYGTLAYNAATDKRFASSDNTPAAGVSLYRFSVGHGNLQCEACHNSTHAEFTNKPSPAGNSLNDNLRAIEAQGYAAAIRECTACHATVPSTANGGPHGMHNIGSSWVVSHHDSVNSSNRADCFYCHGSTSAGSPLAVIKTTKTFNIGDSRTKSFAVDERVTCWSCHNGPNP